jgi:hypothetical protein
MREDQKGRQRQGRWRGAQLVKDATKKPFFLTELKNL